MVRQSKGQRSLLGEHVFILQVSDNTDNETKQTCFQILSALIFFFHLFYEVVCPKLDRAVDVPAIDHTLSAELTVE